MNIHRNNDEHDLADCIGNVDVSAKRDFVDNYLICELM